MLAALALIASQSAACGDDGERQDVDEPSGEFPIGLVSAKFPDAQRLAQTSDLRLEVENAGSEPVPNLAVTIRTGEATASGPFSIRSEQAGLSNANRPVWILENGFPKLVAPGVGDDGLDSAPTAGANAAQTNTFAFGSVPPGETLEIVWRVTPVAAGTYPVRFELAAGLTGKAKAVSPAGGPVEGEFEVTITDRPPVASVNGAGEVVIEQP